MQHNILIFGASYGSLFATKLLMAGHRVTTATNSQEALLVINRETFDLIVLDNSMPGESGVSLIKKKIGRAHV